MPRKPFTAEVTRVFGCSDKTDNELRIEVNQKLLKLHIKDLVAAESQKKQGA